MIIFSLFGCSNVLLNNDLSQNQDEVLVTFSINSGNGNSTRTILPKTISEADSDLFFVIEGRSSRGERLETKLESLSLTGKISLSKTLWELTLKLYKTNPDNAEVLLMQDTIVENFSDGVDTIFFSLSEKNVSTKGGCDLIFEFTSDSVNSVNVDFTNISTGTTVYSAENLEISTDENDANQKIIRYENSEITHGQYILKVNFFNSNNELLACWCDVLFIAAGLTTTNLTSIPENIFGKVPTSPTNLIGTISTVESKTTLTLTWSDNSDNESCFEISVYKYETEESSEGTLYKTYFAFPGDETLTIEDLETGFYNVEILAKNRFGTSEKSTLQEKIIHGQN